MKLLLAEDENDLRDVLTAYLTAAGYEVDAVENGALAVERTDAAAYDGIILDVMMPVMDGITALRTMRARNTLTPVLMLTARAEIADRIAGLDAGADDYLTKPFAMGELLARLRSLTRRGTRYNPRIVTLGNATLDTAEGTLTADNSIQLAFREARLLELFMMNPDRPMGAKEILERIWRDEAEADAAVVRMYAAFLQGKLQAVGARLILRAEEDRYELTEGAP